MERFFFDIVGSVIPGAILLAGLWIILEPSLRHIGIAPPDSAAGWWMFLAIAFAVGNGMTKFGESVVQGVSLKLRRWLFPRSWWKIVRSPDELYSEISQRNSFKKFARQVFPEIEINSSHIHELRSIALTAISAEDKGTVVRFMFLSLFNLGIATAIWLLALAALYRINLISWSWSIPRLSWSSENALLSALVILLAAVLSPWFIVRRYEFYDRSIRLPFDMAIGTKTHDSGTMMNAAAVCQRSNANRIVYLAGGTHSPWRNAAMAEAPSFRYLDPSIHGLEDPRAYTAWDLNAVRSCDIVFAYLEGDNPSGYGLAVEIGYAAALGKHIIFIEEESARFTDRKRYLGIVRAVSNVYFMSIKEGINYLSRLGLLSG